MPCAETYKEHIMYTFNGYCKTVIRYAAINKWRDRSKRRQKEISLLLRALHTAGNEGNVGTLPEYDRVSNPQNFTAPAKENSNSDLMSRKYKKPIPF